MSVPSPGDGAGLGRPVRSNLDGRHLVIRADASRAAGTGHLMRALALAQAWLDRGGSVRWLLSEAPEALEARIAGEGIEIQRVAASPGSPADADALRTALERDMVDRGDRDDQGEASAVAAIDGSVFDSAYLSALGPTADRVLVVDDAADRASYSVALVLNQNAHADPAAYPADAPARLLLGTRFVLLRREFVPDPPERPTPTLARHLLVTLGGADPGGVTARVVRALAALPPALRDQAEVRVVVGAANVDGGRLEDAARGLAGTIDVSVLNGVTDMPGLLAWADLAITSGGSTVWELARMGCPALVIETVPVESLLVSGLARVGLDDLLGHADGLEDATITAAVAARIEDRPWRGAMSALGRRLVDGRGAARVVDALAEVSGSG